MEGRHQPVDRQSHILVTLLPECTMPSDRLEAKLTAPLFKMVSLGANEDLNLQSCIGWVQSTRDGGCHSADFGKNGSRSSVNGHFRWGFAVQLKARTGRHAAEGDSTASSRH